MGYGSRRYRGFGLGTGVVLLALVLAFFVPWRALVEAQLKTALEGQGLSDVQLTLDYIGPDRLVLREMTVGQTLPVTLQDITLRYNLAELMEGKIEALEVEGLVFSLQKEGSAWRVGGFDAQGEGQKGAPPLALPVTNDGVAAIPLSRGALRNAQMQVKSDDWRATVPVDLFWNKAPVPTLNLETKAFVFAFGEAQAHFEKVDATSQFNAEKQQWNGTWQVKGLQLRGTGQDIPNFEGQGTLLLNAENLVIAGSFKSTKGEYRAAFRYLLPLKDMDKAALTVTQASLPWMDGLVEARQVIVPLGKDRPPLRLTLNLYHVSIESLLRTLTGKEMSASGSLSGAVPLVYSERDGLKILEGGLLADAPGVIALSPDLIPGSHESVIFVRDVMSNLHYSLLSLRTQSGDDGNLAVLMTVEGKNPDVAGGRPVKMNVNLTGDMLGLIQQNMLWLSDPRKLLKRGEK